MVLGKYNTSTNDFKVINRLIFKTPNYNLRRILINEVTNNQYGGS